MCSEDKRKRYSDGKCKGNVKRCEGQSFNICIVGNTTQGVEEIFEATMTKIVQN